MVPADSLPPWHDDDDLLAIVVRTGTPACRVVAWPRREVVVGRGGDPAREVDLAAAAAAGVPVRRRRGGGCAVLLDPGNVVVSVVLPLGGVGGVTRAFRAATAWLAAGLDTCGCPGVTGAGVSDLVRDDRKVGGSCIYRSRGLLYYSTTLLVDPDLDLMDHLLSHPPREPAYRAGRPHREFLGRVADDDGLTAPALARRLAAVLDPGRLLAAVVPDRPVAPPRG